MSWINNLTEKCVSVCKVPNSLNKDDILSLIKANVFLANVNILSIELVPGAEEGQQRWVLLFNSAENARALLTMKSEEMTFNNETFTVDYQSSIPCEIPEQWKAYVTEMDALNPPSSNTEVPQCDLPKYQWDYQNYSLLAPVFEQSGQGLMPGQQSGAGCMPYHNQEVKNVPGYQPFRTPQPNHMQRQFPTNDFTHMSYHQTPRNLLKQTNIPPEMYFHKPDMHFPLRNNEKPSPFDATSGNVPLKFNENFKQWMPFDPKTEQFIFVPFLPGSGSQPYFSTFSRSKEQANYENDYEPPDKLHWPNDNLDETGFKMEMDTSVDSKTQDTLHQSQATAKALTKIVVSNISAKNLNEDFIKMTFESKKYGFQEVVSVEINEKTASAIVEFANSEAMEQILLQHPILIGKEEVTVDRYIPDEEFQEADDTSQTAAKALTQIMVSNISAKYLNEDLIKMTFESKKYGYHEVLSVTINEETASAIVEFANSEAMEQILLQHPILIGKEEVTVDRYIPDEEFQEAVDTSQTAAKALTQIMVSNISAKYLNEDLIKMTFESKKYGFQEVVSVEINEETASAIVEFANSEVVEQILQKCPILIGKEEVAVDRYTPKEDSLELDGRSDYSKRATHIALSNLPSDITDEYLQLFFEHRRFGGWAVDTITMIEDNMAIVKFEEPEAVQKVMESCPIQMNSTTVEVVIYVPKPVELNTIEVRGPPSVVNKEQISFLEMYFDNKKRSGGEDVVQCTFDSEENVAYITFKTEDVAKCVVHKSNHQLNKQQIDVKLHMPKRKVPEKIQANDGSKNNPQQPQCIVKVKGFSKSKSVNTLQYYFENERRSGGGGEVLIETDEEDENLLYVTFKNAHVAERVAKGSHTVEGCDLVVTLHTPPKPKPFYENRILIKGMKSTTTKDGLFNFLEAKSTCIPLDLTHHAEEEGTVMVTFEKIDFERAKQEIGKYKLEGATLKMSRIPISNCIQVANLAPEVTKDTVEFYFENSRKSGGGPIDKVVMQRNDRSCLVYFNDFKVIDNVLRQEHKLSEQKLEVFRFLECLNAREGGGERKLQIPEPVIVADIASHKIKFLKNSQFNKNTLETQLKSCHANVLWPNNDNDSISIICTLTKDVKDCFKLTRVWQESAKDSFNAFMKNIIIHQTNVLQDIWEKVMAELKAIQIPNPEGVALFVDKKDGLVTVVGMKHVVDDLAKKISDKIKKVNDQAERERQRVKETFSNLKPIETKMLLVDKFATKMEDIFIDLKVCINKKKNEIIFDGVCGDVREAKLKLYEIKSGFEERHIDNLSAVIIGLFSSKQAKEYIVKKLKQRNLTAVWEVSGQSLHICSYTETMHESIEIIKGSVIERTIAIDHAAQIVMDTQQWNKKLEEWHSAHAGKCQINYQEISRNIQVCATSDVFNDVLQNVDTFLRFNTVYDDKISFDRSVHRLIEKHHKSNVTDIAKGLQQSHVQIGYGSTYSHFEIKGTKDGIAAAKKELQTLVKKVHMKEHLIKKPGLRAYIKSSKGKDNINTVESMLLCVVEIKGQTYPSAESEPSAEGTPAVHKDGVRIDAKCKIYNRVIFTAEGDMTELTVDVLVNSADEKLNLLSGLGKAMMSKGGPSIKKDCIKHIKLHGNLKPGEVAVCDAGDLKAMHIIHVYGPSWKDGSNQEENVLTKAVYESLKNASLTQAKSIAIPAISCGAYAFPVELATLTIVRAVQKFFSREQDSSITEIYLCDVKGETVTKFSDALVDLFGKRNVTLMHDDDVDDDFEAYRPKKAHQQTVLPPHSTGNDGNKIGNVIVTVLHGEIANQKVDVITNTTSKNLDLKNGAVSLSLLKAASPNLQNEILNTCPNGIQGDEVVITTGQRLKCKRVVHGSLPNWKVGDSSSIKALHVFMHRCLGEANKQNFTSVAFPALGTGNLAFPKDIVAREMFLAISKFANDNPKSSVNDVRIILYPRDTSTIQAFEKEEKLWKTGERVGIRSSRKIESVYAQMHQQKQDMDDDYGNRYEDVPGNNRDQQIDIKIIVKSGDIIMEKVDCIVNSSNENLDLSQGAVSQAISQIGGSSLYNELESKRLQMQKNGLVVTSAPGLQCQFIIHIVAQEAIQEWRKVISYCLHVADQNKASSIAFPALGTAGASMNPDDIASAMVKEVMEFEKSKPESLKEVRFVIFQQQMFQTFDTAVKNAKQSGGLFDSVKKAISGIWNHGNWQNKSSTESHNKRKNHKNIDQDEATFIIWSMKSNVLDEAAKKLESFLEKEMYTKKFNDSIIKRFDNNQIMEITAIGKQSHVEISIDTKLGEIKVCGMATNVMSVTDKIHGFMKDVSLNEQDRNAADILSNVVEWFYIEITNSGQMLQPYEKYLNYKIEMAFKQGLPSIDFISENGEKFTLQFNTMEECSQDDPTDKVKVIRRDHIKERSFALPKIWSDMKENLRIVPLSTSDKEFTDVATKFKASSGFQNIHKIERIQNKALWQQYHAKMKQLESQNPSSVTNEKFLWHGTAFDTVDSINAHGFNRSYCGKNATAYGDGVYFAVSARYSCSNTYSRPDPNTSIKYVYYCRVLTGEYAVGKGGMRVPPNKPGAGSHILYDSVVDNVQSPSMYIIFHDTQAYPEYLISFK